MTSMTIEALDGVMTLGELSDRVEELYRQFGAGAEVRVRTKLGATAAGSRVRSITAIESK